MMNSANHTDSLDYAAFLANLEEKLANIESERLAIEAKEAALKRSIASIREFIAVESGEALPSNAAKIIVPKRAFKGLQVIDAAEKYLHMAKTGRTAREIAEGLQEGNIDTKSPFKHFVANLRTALRRQGEDRGIVRRGNRFWLKSWPYTPEEQESDRRDEAEASPKTSSS